MKGGFTVPHIDSHVARAARRLLVLLVVSGAGIASAWSEAPSGSSDRPSDTTVFPMHHSAPAWSRQGLIAYQDRGVYCVRNSGYYHLDPELRGIWVVNPRTGVRSQLLRGGMTPGWSPDGRHLAIGGIYVTLVDSINPVQVTFCGGSLGPEWSPDGQLIVYESNCEGPAYKTWVMRADGTEQRNIAPDRAAKRGPSWSPDGSRIVHVRYAGGAGELFGMDADGSNPIRLTTTRADDRDPQYSPDGRFIAFASQSHVEGDPLPQVWVMNADGNAPRRLTDRGGSEPSWSPDGTEIVFVRNDWFSNDPGNGVLWIVNVETGAERQLLSKWPNRCPTPVAPKTWGDVKRAFR